MYYELYDGDPSDPASTKVGELRYDGADSIVLSNEQEGEQITLGPNGVAELADANHKHVGETLEDIGVLASNILRVKDSSDIQIDVPSDYATLSNALTAAAQYQTRYDSQIIVNVEDGQTITDDVTLTDADLSDVTITTPTNPITVDAGASFNGNSVISLERTSGLHIDAEIDGNGTPNQVISATSSDFVINGGVINSGDTNVDLWGSTMHAPAGTFTGAGLHGIKADRGSAVVAPSGDVSNADDTGLRIVGHSWCMFRDGTATGAGDRNIYANRRSSINAHSCVADDAGLYGVLASDSSLIDVRSSQIYNAGEAGCFCRRAARILADRSDVQGAGSASYFVERGGMIHVHNNPAGAEVDAVGMSDRLYDDTNRFSGADVPIRPGTFNRAGFVNNDQTLDAQDSWCEHAVEVTRSATQGLTAGTEAKVAFDTVKTDPVGNWDGTNNVYDLPRGGIWDVTASVTLDDSNGTIASGDEVLLYAGAASGVASADRAANLTYATGVRDTFVVTRQMRLQNGDSVGVWIESRDSDATIQNYEASTYLHASFVRPFHPDE